MSQMPAPSLIPSFNMLSDDVQATLFPQITDLDLRRVVFANENLQPKILDTALKQHGITAEIAEDNIPHEAKLRVALDHDRIGLLQIIGGAYNAEILAKSVAQGHLRLSDTDIPREIIKQSLAFRGIGLQRREVKTLTCRYLENDGLDCLICWFNTLPVPFSILAKMRFPNSAVADSASDCKSRVKLCAAVLASLEPGEDTA